MKTEGNTHFEQEKLFARTIVFVYAKKETEKENQVLSYSYGP